MIDKYGEYLIPDLKHYFGIDLRDLFLEDNPMSPAWCLMHVLNLPLDSAFVAEQRGGQQFRGWDEGRYMMATLINAVRASNYFFLLANTDPKKNNKLKPPESYPLPDGNKSKSKAKQADRPGSFAFIAKAHAAAVRKRREGG